MRADGDPNVPAINGLPAYSLIGQWSRSPYRLETNTAWGVPFFVGTNALLTAPSTPGDYYLFLAVNDTDYSDNFAAYRVSARWQICQLTSFDYVLGTATNTLYPARTGKPTDWLLLQTHPQRICNFCPDGTSMLRLIASCLQKVPA